MADCLSLPDETYISLPGVMVDRLDENSQYLVVKDPWSANVRLIVFLNDQISVVPGQIVDVFGYLTTLRSGHRAVIRSTVDGYTDNFGSMDGKVYCLNASSDALIWSFQTKKRDNESHAKIIQSPVVYDGVVYIGNESARVYALDAEDGTEVWGSSYDVHPDELESGKEDITGVSSVAISNIGGQDLLYFGCDNGYLYCINASDKELVWSYRPEYYGCIESSPTIYAGNVYFGISFFQGFNIFALNAQNGELVWTRRLMPKGTKPHSNDYDQGEEIRATCAAMDNAIYVGEDTGHYFYRLNAQTGETEPDQFPPNPFYPGVGVSGINYFVGSAALSSAGDVIVGNDNGRVYSLENNDLDLLALYNTIENGNNNLNSFVCSSPAISYSAQTGYKWLYIVSRGDNGRGDGKGTVFAFYKYIN